MILTSFLSVSSPKDHDSMLQESLQVVCTPAHYIFFYLNSLRMRHRFNCVCMFVCIWVCEVKSHFSYSNVYTIEYLCWRVAVVVVVFVPSLVQNTFYPQTIRGSVLNVILWVWCYIYPWSYYGSKILRTQHEDKTNFYFIWAYFYFT